MQFTKTLVVLLPFFLGSAMAGKAKDALTEFIAGIPANRLTGFPGSAGTIYKTEDFRLDMQGLTTEKKGKPQSLNLQIQVNGQTKVKQLQKLAPATVAGPVLVPVKDAASWSAEKVRKAFKDTMKI